MSELYSPAVFKAVLDGLNPDDPSNRRVSLIVNNFTKSESAPGAQESSPVVGGATASVEADQSGTK